MGEVTLLEWNGMGGSHTCYLCVRFLWLFFFFFTSRLSYETVTHPGFASQWSWKKYLVMNGMLFKALLKNTKLTQLVIKKKKDCANHFLFQPMVTLYNRKEFLEILSLSPPYILPTISPSLFPWPWVPDSIPLKRSLVLKQLSLINHMVSPFNYFKSV